MKQLLIFFALFFSCMFIDIRNVDLTEYQTDEIEVQITGEVEEPGNYKLTMYSTIQEALDMAGVKDNADLTGINTQILLKDKDKIDVPKKNNHVLKISINTATIEQLCNLPGIGKSTAEKIVTYRNENGLFQKKEDLMKVKGIGPAKFEKMKDNISL